MRPDRTDSTHFGAIPTDSTDSGPDSTDLRSRAQIPRTRQTWGPIQRTPTDLGIDSTDSKYGLRDYSLAMSQKQPNLQAHTMANGSPAMTRPNNRYLLLLPTNANDCKRLARHGFCRRYLSQMEHVSQQQKPKHAKTLEKFFMFAMNFLGQIRSGTPNRMMKDVRNSRVLEWVAGVALTPQKMFVVFERSTRTGCFPISQNHYKNKSFQSFGSGRW